VKKKYIDDILYRNVSIRASKFLKLIEEAGIDIDGKKVYISSRKKIPSILEITPEFSLFLGLWVAEGSYNKNYSVRLSINSSEENEIIQLCLNLFGNVSIYRKGAGVDIYISSKPLVIVMKKILKLKDSAKNKKVPTIAYNLSPVNLAYFLRGIFSGDGSVYLTSKGSTIIEVSSVSKELIDDLMYLLLYFGIRARVIKSKNIYRLLIGGAENLVKFLKIGFIQEEKNEKIIKYLKEIKWSRSSKIPINGLSENMLKLFPRWKNSEYIGVRKLVETKNETLLQVATCDISWEKVIKVRKIGERKFVYDLEVEPTQNFIAGFGGIFAHNSEKRVRELFKRAKQVAPCIIFFDELDA
jgi:DNA polymerase I